MICFVVEMEGWSSRAYQPLVDVRVPRKACGDEEGEELVEEDFTLREYKPFWLSMMRGILMWRSLIAQDEEKKLIDRSGLSLSNLDKLIRFVEKLGTCRTCLVV
jgi:hypothetical protein